MVQYTCLNPIAACGLDLFSDDYKKVEELNDADVVLVRSAAMHDLELPERLTAVARAGAGVNNIPLDKCAEKGIVVFNSPGANSNGVKELVIAGMLLACRDINGGIEWVKENAADENIAKTTEKAKKAFAGTEIYGKKLGVIGLGAIGIKVANAAQALGMDVYGYDPYLSVNAAWSISRNVVHVDDPMEIYKNCDFITIHVPLTDSTTGMIGKEAIEAMKETAVILNFARDTLVDEDAVVAALAEGKLRKYVVDFPSVRTAGKEGCIVIPHLGASTEESEDNCAIMAVNEIRDYIENGNIKNSVNYPACNMGALKAACRIGILHKNVAGAIAKFSTIIGDAGINIAEMQNASRGDFAYTLIDIDAAASDDVVAKISGMDEVIRVRVIG